MTSDVVSPIGRLVVTPRALAEYRDMFVLTDADLLAGPILDCPAGASRLARRSASAVERW